MKRGEHMSSKYSILAKNYSDRLYPVNVRTNSRFKAIKTLIGALYEYELVEFMRRR